ETTSATAIETTSAIAIETPSAIAIETTSAIAIETTSAIAIETTSAIAIETTSAIAIETTSAIATETTSAIAIDTTSAIAAVATPSATPTPTPTPATCAPGANGPAMNRKTNSSEHATQAIFSVCADEDVVQAATTASMNIPGALFAGEFRDYITAEKRPQFSSLLKNADSCVALIDFDRDPELAIETTDRLRQIFLKKIGIVGIGARLDAGILLRSMRNGCTEFLTKPVSLADLIASLNRFNEVLAVDADAQSSVGRVISFFGAKGGVGTTMLAVHLAIFLVRQHGKKVLLIDHKQQLGHVALYLGLKDTQYH